MAILDIIQKATGVSALVLLPLVAVGYALLKLLYTGLTCHTKHLPGPWYARFTHLRLKRAVVTGRRSFYIHDLHQKYGPIVRISPTEVAVADLSAFKEIHRIGTKYLKSTWYEDLANFPKKGIFTMRDPKEYGARRKLLAASFSKTYLMTHWESEVRSKAHLCVSKIKDDAIRKGTADVYNWWMLLASDVTAHLSFGESFGMLEAGKANQFMRVLKKLTIGAGIMVELPFLRLLGYIPTPTMQEMFNGNEYILKGADRAVELARSRSGEQNIFAKVIEDSEKEGEGHIDDMDVRVEASNIIIAGTDTTGCTLTYLTWAVLQRPELQKALEKEVATLPEDFVEKDVMELPLLNAIVEETHRLYGAAPSSLPRVVPKGGSHLGGHYIPGDTTVSTQAFTFHRDENVWSDPLTFNPYRWLPGQDGSPAEALSEDAKAAFHPFGVGSRSCVGIHLARMEMRYAVAFLFRECKGLKLSKSTTPETMEFENFFLITPKGHHCHVEFA
ncbi:cytochrome P450 [Periconia macrospinosa]|uniref:Cytochrome P450 n=1 Tax=Periconia macrospinosa TaxID=97972 RepID=A0A2V1E087_9PLEO|nr:cytochrome P450 [Periconia macrospinosa]